MTARSQLEFYLDSVRRRLQWVLSAQGVALLVLALFVVTLIAAPLLRSFGFADAFALVARALLVLAAAGAVAWFLWRRRALRRDEGATALERALPGQSGRVATYLQERQRPDGASPLLGLLAADALAHADAEPAASAVPRWRIFVPVGVGAAALVLFGLLFVVNGPWSEGARQLWIGHLPPATSIAAAAGGIAVKPGDATVRRNQDLSIEALVAGSSEDVQVHVRFENGEWQTTSMERGKTGSFAFTLYALREGGEYYVTAGRLKSKEHHIQVVDLPTVDKLRLTYNYPGWTGLPQRTDEGGGDIRAVEGTAVGIQVVTSAPLQGPLLVIDGNNQTLSQSGTTSKGQLAVKKSGHYRIATRFLGEIVPLTPDYIIDVAPDEKPDVRVVKPGKDYRATNIEEVPVRVQARDDYRLEALELHYSVNGSDFRTESLPAGSADVQAAALLRMEQMQKRGPGGEAPLLVPGDLVSYYALARDHSHSVQTDLFLIQIQAFDQRYTQGQAGGGGGGGGGGGEEEGNISKRQKEVLLATWNLQRNQEESGQRDAERNADNARMLSQVQSTLAEQAGTLVDRAKARQLTGQDESVTNFVKNMEEATKAMDPAAKNLSNMKLADAVKYEQQALQLLLRAESSYRDIQVAMRNQRGGGGGGGGSQAGRDVSEMTELEMDLAKNQYETEQQVNQEQGGANSEAEDEMMRRLRELAKRQEQMARETARQQQLTEAQKWQQEQLRREAEQLRQQLEQMAQQQSQGGSPSQQSGSQSGSQSQSSQQQASQQRGSQQQSSAQQAAQQVAQALQQMQQGGSQNQQRASEQLNKAREQLERGQQQADGQKFNKLAEEAGELAERQRNSERELRAAVGNSRQQQGQQPGASQNLPRNATTYEQLDKMAATRRDLQGDLEALQRRIDNTRRQNTQQSPRASGQLAEARKELQEMETANALARSAYDVERGRITQAASNDPVISDTLRRLQQNLAVAADTAAGESGARQQGRKADATDLLAELGDLRRALDRAREQQLAQNQSGAGEPGANSPDAREGQRGQAGGERGQQGQGQQGQGQQGGQQGQGQGQQPGQQGGENGNGPGGRGDQNVAGGGSRNGGGGVWDGGRNLRVGAVAWNGAELRNQTQLSAERLAQIRAQLANGVLTAADTSMLQDLEKRLQRGPVDPMSSEYQKMTALVDQLELTALKAQQAKDSKKPTRTDDTVDDSRRYRDNVAEYYRRLGGGNE